MRALFSIVSLLVVVAIVGVLLNKQLSRAPLQPTSAEGAMHLPAPAAGATPQQQSRQIQQQVRQTLEHTLQQARPMPEDQ